MSFWTKGKQPVETVAAPAPSRGILPASVVFDRRESDLWDVVAASAIGSSHEQRGHPRQDAFAIAIAGDAAIVALADGLGSSPRAEVGASIACEAVVTTLVEALAVKGGFTARTPQKEQEKAARAAVAATRTKVLAAA